jgi:hypothetical protein
VVVMKPLYIAAIINLCWFLAQVYKLPTFFKFN